MTIEEINQKFLYELGEYAAQADHVKDHIDCIRLLNKQCAMLARTLSNLIHFVGNQSRSPVLTTPQTQTEPYNT